MDIFEYQDALDSMVVYVDSREQNTVQSKRRYKDIGTKIERKALFAGDYSAYFSLRDGTIVLDLSDKVAIERKMSLDELCSCYCQSRKRFTAEFDRAGAKGIKLYLLIETGNFENAYTGRYRSKMRPSALIASILTWLARYNCQIIMCKAETSGNLIRDILYYEGRERLGGLITGGTD